jgi:hypothetical protein
MSAVPLVRKGRSSRFDVMMRSSLSRDGVLLLGEFPSDLSADARVEAMASAVTAVQTYTHTRSALMPG